MYLGGLLFTALCKWRKAKGGSSPHAWLTCLTLFRGFKDPPEVNTHMVGRLVCEKKDETDSDSLSSPFPAPPPPLLLMHDFFNGNKDLKIQVAVKLAQNFIQLIIVPFVIFIP